MKRLILPVLLSVSLAPGCVLDRTGKSATEAYRRELALHGARLSSLESELDETAQRVENLEQLNRARGQQEILKMETLEQVRGEVYRLRGEMEELRFSYDRSSSEGSAYQQDAAFRLAWLEARADQLEEKLELAPPPPPEVEEAPASPEDASSAAPDAGAAPPAAPAQPAADPDALIDAAEKALAAGDAAAAEAAMERFLEAFPNHARLPEARYRRAEAAFNAKEYPQAVLRFQEVIDKHKDSRWAPWAMLRQGESFDAQGQPDNARLFYEDVSRYWPKSKAAAEAKRKLK